MPNIKSAEKRVRVAERKRLRNRIVRSRTRTMVTQVRRAATTGDVQTAESRLREAISALDKAAAKGVIHRNSAARRKSRLMHALQKARAAQGT